MHVSTSNRWRAIAAATGLVTVMAGVAACGSDDSGAAAAAGGTLTFALDSSPDNLDPNSSSSSVNAEVMRQVYDSLVHRTKDGDYEPWLATSWEVSKDGKVYTFELRDDVKFHDGTPFDAKAVCFNFDRITDPKTQSKSAISALGDTYKACKVTGDHEVELTLTQPTFDWLSGLSQVWTGIESPAAIKKYGDQVVTHPVGTGPFKFVKMQLNQQVVLAKNADYRWNPEGAKHQGPAELDQLVLKVIPESTTRFRSVGVDIDAAESIAPQDVNAAKANSALTVDTVPVVGTPYQLFLNTTHAPWDDVEARKAVRSAMNVPAIIKSLYFGVYDRAWGPLTPPTKFYDDSVEDGWEYDPDAAASAFDDLGWTMGSDGYRHKAGKTLQMDYLVPSDKREKRQEVAQFLQENLKQVGVKVNLHFEASGPYDAMRDDNKYDVIGLSLTSGFSTLNAIYDSRNAPGADGDSYYNYSRLDDPEIDKLLAKSDSVTSDEQAAEVYSAVQQYVVDNAVSVPIYNYQYTVVATDKVDGIAYNWKSYPLFVGATVSK
ncbi:MAG TPA: ABC transporter substrate-binding protein [Marmoricola sp.]|jgi:peptide/nickel transport system substrate-binding protein|nr:ABC transporter substrate-binding protein [Marmoricola sp.]